MVAAPHIGHLYTLVLADILKRWHAVLGEKSILCTGTDEHGMKIQQAAAKEGKDVRAFCDEMYKPFESLAKEANIDWTHFIRTSEPDHRFAVQHFWLMLRQRDLIYEGKHEGWYSISDETFYPESAVQLALDPRTGRKHMASKETGKEVEWTSERNYHFRLSAFRDRLLDFYKKNPSFIIPKGRMLDVVDEVTQGLKDLSISRPKHRLTWGIPVPDDDSQTIYVWLDALINYLTKANYPFQVPGEESAAGWPADCHVIGKDIVRFHGIYWPAFLMALDLPPPRQLLTHAHWTIGHRKMSKSTGVTVNPFFAMVRFGTDTMRYFLTLDGGLSNDSSYDNSFIIKRYKTELQGALGNLVSRLTRGKGWSVRESIERYHGRPEGLHKDFRKYLEGVPDSVKKDLAEPNPGAGLAKIMDAVYQTNAYMQHEAPWTMKGSEKEDEKNACIFMCAESLRICGILLQPFMPDKMKQLLDTLGVSDDARFFSNTEFGSDGDFGEVPASRRDETAPNLFPPLTSLM